VSEEQSRRAFLRAAIVAGVVTPGGLSTIVSRALAQGEVNTGVHKFRGQVEINGQAATRGAAVKPGDTVTTGAESYVTFVVGQDAFLLRGNSRLELEGSGVLVNLARIVTGKLLSVYGKGTPRTVRGTTATIGIRGTGAYIEVSPERNYFCLCYGEAEIVPVADPSASETVKTIHHDSPRFIYAGGRSRIVERAPVINHKDEELILLESLVGRVPPFVNTDEYRSGVRY
jgi:hypothetical protein